MPVPVQPWQRPDLVLARRACALPIARLDAKIEHLRQQTRAFIDTDEPLQDTLDLLISVTGIAGASAIQLLGEPLLLPEEMQVRQWGTMAGIDPPQLHFGPSVNKKPPPQSRQLLPAHCPPSYPLLSPVRHDPNSRVLPQLIEKRSLNRPQAVCTIGC